MEYEAAGIQKSDPKLDVIMCEIQDRLARHLRDDLREICGHLGIVRGEVVANTRAASLGESGEIMLVTIISTRGI